MWRLCVSVLASVLGATLLLRGYDNEPTTRLPVPLLPPVTVQAPVVAIAPSLAGESLGGDVAEPHWDEALALAMAHPSTSHKPRLIARASTRQTVAVRTRPAVSQGLGATLQAVVRPVGKVVAWFSSHAVRTSLRNDEVAGG